MQAGRHFKIFFLFFICLAQFGRNTAQVTGDTIVQDSAAMFPDSADVPPPPDGKVRVSVDRNEENFVTVDSVLTLKDSVLTLKEKDTTLKHIVIKFIKNPIRTFFKHEQYNPKVAWICSAVVPGLGQIYNRRWWTGVRCSGQGRV